MRAWHTILGRSASLQLRPTRQSLRSSFSSIPSFKRLSRQFLCYDSASTNDRIVENTTVINKVPTSFAMTPQLYQYLLEHTREPEVLQQLREETSSMSGHQMQITPEQGAFMSLLVQLCNARNIVEVGVFTGYSSIAMALALPEDGKLHAFDKDHVSMAVARKYWELAGVRHKVHDKLAPALESLEDLLQSAGPESMDIGFIDADKRAYDAYYELLLKLVRPGGLIIVDNVLWYGKVADPEVQDKQTIALRELNAKLVKDPRISFSMVPVGDGMALCRRR